MECMDNKIVTSERPVYVSDHHSLKYKFHFGINETGWGKVPTAGICEGDDEVPTKAHLPQTTDVNLYGRLQFKMLCIILIMGTSPVLWAQYKLPLPSHLSKNLKGLIILFLFPIPSYRISPNFLHPVPQCYPLPYINLPICIHTPTPFHTIGHIIGRFITP
jgi:hypothetical protein